LGRVFSPTTTPFGAAFLTFGGFALPLVPNDPPPLPWIFPFPVTRPFSSSGPYVSLGLSNFPAVPGIIPPYVFPTPSFHDNSLPFLCLPAFSQSIFRLHLRSFHTPRFFPFGTRFFLTAKFEGLLLAFPVHRKHFPPATVLFFFYGIGFPFRRSHRFFFFFYCLFLRAAFFVPFFYQVVP